MQSLLGRLKYPRGFNRNYHDVVTHIDGYTMEEYSNLLWIGSIIASKGPLGFQKLWGLLQPAAKHYLYGLYGCQSRGEIDSSALCARVRSRARALGRPEEGVTACSCAVDGIVARLCLIATTHPCLLVLVQFTAHKLLRSAHVMFCFVIQSRCRSPDEEMTAACATYSSHARNFTDAIVQVPLRMLTPNLHILVCRFPVQEALRGLVSLELEYFMERYMSDPQRGMRALHAKKNHLNSTEMPCRALLPAPVYHGFRTPDQLSSSLACSSSRVL